MLASQGILMSCPGDRCYLTNFIVLTVCKHFEREIRSTKSPSDNTELVGKLRKACGSADKKYVNFAQGLETYLYTRTYNFSVLFWAVLSSTVFLFVFPKMIL